MERKILILTIRQAYLRYPLRPNNRHMNWVSRVKQGKYTIVSREDWEAGYKKNSSYNQNHTPIDIWEGARRAARAAEKQLGKGNFGPYDDFVWGMINIKLSALRWMRQLGDEWDMLWSCAVRHVAGIRMQAASPRLDCRNWLLLESLEFRGTASSEEALVRHGSRAFPRESVFNKGVKCKF